MFQSGDRALKNESIEHQIHEGFLRLLGEESSFRFQLHIDNSYHTPYGIVGQSPLHQAFHAHSYELKMEFLTPINDVIKARSTMGNFIVGKYRPTVVNIKQDYKHASMVTSLEYHIDNIEDFLKQLELENWKRYSSEFDENIAKITEDN